MVVLVVTVLGLVLLPFLILLSPLLMWLLVPTVVGLALLAAARGINHQRRLTPLHT